MQKFRLYPRRRGYNINYNKWQDPRVPNVFAAASFRFGHTMIPEWIRPNASNGKPDTGPAGAPLDINDVQFRWDLFG